MSRFRVPEFVVALLFLTGAGAAPAAEPLDEAASREFPPALLFAGAPAERGRAYGAELREPIRQFLDREIYAPFVGRPATKEALLAYAEACGNVVDRECPLVAAEFHGVAAGAGLTFAEVMLVNLHEELYHRTDLPKQGHCTAVAVAPPDTGDDHAYVGQTWDWMQSVAGKSRMLEWRRGGGNDGASVLAYGFPGMPFGAGVSSSGIALCWTSAALGTKGTSPRVGIPSYVLIAHLLAQPDLDAVVREAKKDRHAGWFTFVMADGAGRLVNLEGSPQKIAVESATDRLVRVGYGSLEMTGTQAGREPPRHARCQLMYDHLQGARGSSNCAGLQNFFADAGYKINVGPATIDMMVFDTTARTAHASRGTTYKLAWKKFEFGADK